MTDPTGEPTDDDVDDGPAPGPRPPRGPLDLVVVWGPRLLLAAGVVVLLVALVLTVTEDDEEVEPPANTFGPTTATTAGSTGTSEPASDASDPATTEEGASSLPAVDGPFAPGRTQLPGYGEVEVRIVDGPGGEPIVLCVLVAETSAQRQQGLMGVSDESLGGYDGMLFRFTDDVDGGFWMKDTLLPLSIAYLDVEGATVDTEDMEPCPPATADCPSYPPSGPYRSALEVPQGGLDRLGLVPGSDARLEVGGACAPAAST